MSETLLKILNQTKASFRPCCVSPPESVEREVKEFLASLEDAEANAEFEAIIGDEPLFTFLDSLQIKIENFKTSVLKSFNPMLSYLTKAGTEHLKVEKALEEMGSKMNQPIFCGNLTLNAKIGNVYVTFFPRYGELQLSLHSKQFKPVR